MSTWHFGLVAGARRRLRCEEKSFTWRVRGWNQPGEGPIALSSRIDAVDEEDRCVHMTIRAEATDGRVEEHTLTMRSWYRDELVPLLERSGFAHVDVLSGVDENIVVHVASRDGDLQPLARED